MVQTGQMQLLSFQKVTMVSLGEWPHHDVSADTKSVESVHLNGLHLRLEDVEDPGRNLLGAK